MDYQRKLVSFRLIRDIIPIDGADNIELALVDGWQVVVKKGEFKVGDFGVYFEIDSWVPHCLAPFLTQSGREPKEYKGIKGERLRTIKLRKQLSQGLLLPVASVFSYSNITIDLDADLSEALGVVKWEPPEDGSLNGKPSGTFPSFIPKTDQPRIQNIWDAVKEHSFLFEVTEKLDGSSMTVYFCDGKFGVCSRNNELKEEEENAFWIAANKANLKEKLHSIGSNIALQGELIGPKIQKNPYNRDGYEFYLFDVFDIDRATYYCSSDRLNLATAMDIKHVPVVAHTQLPSFEELLEFSDGKSALSNADREGIVFKSVQDPSVSFKVISNKWLLKN